MTLLSFLDFYHKTLTCFLHNPILVHNCADTSSCERAASDLFRSVYWVRLQAWYLSASLQAQLCQRQKVKRELELAGCYWRGERCMAYIEPYVACRISLICEMPYSSVYNLKWRP